MLRAMRTLGPDDLKFRELVEKLNGVQKDVAAALGITQSSVAWRLKSEKHCVWWLNFKHRRTRKRRQLRQQRQYKARKARQDRAQLDMQDPAGALERALARAALDSL